MSSWVVQYAVEVIREDIPLLSKVMRVRVNAAVNQKLAVHPLTFGKPLQGSLRGHRRLRVGDWRVVYRADSATHVVIILKIAHRREVYDD